MKQQGLFSKQPQKWRYQDKDRQIFDNILARQFSTKPHITVLCGDTTYLKVKGARHYLAVVINLGAVLDNQTKFPLTSCFKMET